MFVDVAKQPERLRVVRWDGTNIQEVNDYIADVPNQTGTAYVVVNDDGTAHVASPMGEHPLVVGSLIYAWGVTWGGPSVAAWTPDEANDALYPYPSFEPIAPESAS